MTVLRIFLALGGIGLTALIVWGFAMDGGWDEVAAVVAMPWGLVTLVDLYLGFFITAVIIWFAERNKAVALLWAAPTFFLGNVWPVVWLIIRAPSLARRLKGDA